MHFAQTLDASIIPEWKSRYVDFVQGKKLIEKIERVLPDPDTLTHQSNETTNEPPAGSAPFNLPPAAITPQQPKKQPPPTKYCNTTPSGTPIAGPSNPRGLFKTPTSIFPISGPLSPSNLTNINNTISGVFFDWLNQEVARSNEFYTEMLNECKMKLDMINKQLEVFVEHRKLHQKDKHPKSSKRADTFFEWLDLPSIPKKLRFWDTENDETGNTFRRHIRRLKTIGMLNPHQSVIERVRILRTSAHTSDFTNSKDSVSYYQAKGMLKTALGELYHSLEQLKGFQQLNMTAIRKIVKKFDKVICDPHKWRHTSNYYLAEIADLPIAKTGDELQNMILTVENVYAFHFTQSNHKQAVDTLKVVAMGEDEESLISLFVSGLLLGLAIPLGVLAVYLALHFREGFYCERTNVVKLISRATDSSPAEVTYLLQILGGFTCIGIIMVGFAACLHLWTWYKINYAFIFELDRTTMMSPPQFLLYGALYCFWLALMAFLTFATTSQSFHRYYPTLVLGVSVFVLVFPFGRTWSGRRWLLHSLWRLLFSGWYPVEFKDLLMGDILSSLTYSLSNMEMFFCVYCASPQWWTIGGSKHAQRCSSSHSRSMGFLNCLPGIFRFLQCLRRYGDTLDWFPHLLNATKYTFTILSNMAMSLARISPDRGGLKAFYIACAVINAVYSGAWDILMDFSLTPSFNKKLRPVLVFPWWCYWIAMCLDLFMRQNWILYVIFWQQKTQGAYISFLVALIEIVRRVLWVIFRVENEHAANIMRCRAFKDLHLPYDDVLKEAEVIHDENASQCSSSVHRRKFLDTNND